MSEMGSSAVSVNDEKGKNYDSEDDDDDDDEDDDDIKDMIVTLQSVYNDVCSTPSSKSKVTSSPSSSSKEMPVSVNGNEEEERESVGEVASPCSFIEENWESSDNESSISINVAKSSFNVDVDQEMFDKLERTRAKLEDVIGMDNLLQAYTLIKDYEDSDEKINDHFPLDQLTSYFGEEHSQYFPTLIHLVIADSAYSELNTQTITPGQDNIDYDEELSLGGSSTIMAVEI
jgi:hypothetical protein